MVIRSLRYTINGWSVVTGVIALSLTIPILYVGSQLFGEASEVWTYVVADLLPGYALNSLVLLLEPASRAKTTTGTSVRLRAFTSMRPGYPGLRTTACTRISR